MSSGISKQTFEGMDVDSKLNVLFDEITELKQKQFINKFLTFAGGIIGGIAAALGIKFGL